MGPRSNSDGRSNVYLFTRMSGHKYIQKLFTIIEFVIIFLIIAFLVATTIPGLLRVRKRSQTSKILTLARSSNRLATV
jgi:Tfp pilus assembly major pilin PilA